MAYRIFISYSSADADVAHHLAKQINQAGVEAITSTGFSDSPKFEPIRKNIMDQIRTSDEMIVLITENSVQNPWASYELGAAWALGKRITPVTVSINPLDLPPPLKSLESVPLSNFDLYVRDLSQRAEKRRA
jgi:hypothetical protein